MEIRARANGSGSGRNMGKYLNPAHVQSIFMHKGGLARDCQCTQSTLWECFDAIMGVKDADGMPVYGKTKCGFDCAKVYTQNIPKRLFEVFADAPVLLGSERQIKNLPLSAKPANRRRRYRNSTRK